MIRLNNFSVQNLYHNLHLSIPKKLNLLTGRNGIGKTVLLDCISGINKKFSGEIIRDGETIYYNQKFYFPNRLKSGDLINFFGDLNNLKNYRKTYLESIEKYCDKFNFHNLLDKKIGMLSEGERKLLYFSAVVSLKREWYILDEPFASIDEIGKEVMISMILDLVKSGKGVILVTHEKTSLDKHPDINRIDIH